MLIIEENSALKKFFRANSQYVALIRQNLAEYLPVLLTEKPYKIKTVAGYRYQGQTIFEYKIPLDKNTDCRVAYIKQNEDIRVFFISNTVVKKEFTKLLAKISGVTASR